jgi:hypothetical protein
MKGDEWQKKEENIRNSSPEKGIFHHATFYYAEVHLCEVPFSWSKKII